MRNKLCSYVGDAPRNRVFAKNSVSKWQDSHFLSTSHKLILFSIFVLMGCSQPIQPEQTIYPSQVIEDDIPFNLPAEVVAGSQVTLTLGPADLLDGIPVTLITQGSYETQLYQTLLQDQFAHFILPAEDTQRTGHVKLTALFQLEQAEIQAESSLTIVPGPPAEPVIPLVGARSIVADGAHWSMIVVVVTDALGNPVAEGTEVHMQAQKPTRQIEEHQFSVHHLLAWARIYSGTKAGRTVISTHSGKAYGPDSLLLEVPGWPVPFEIYTEWRALPADGEALVRLYTAVLQDQFGNVVPDGTLVNFVAERVTAENVLPDPGAPPSVLSRYHFPYSQNLGRRIIPAYTLNGVAEIPLQAPQAAGSFNVHATLYGIRSTVQQITFTPSPSEGRFPITAVVEEEENLLVVDAGPILGTLAQYVPDGTVVKFQIQDGIGRVWQQNSITEGGHAQIELPLQMKAIQGYHIWASVDGASSEAEFTVSLVEDIWMVR